MNNYETKKRSAQTKIYLEKQKHKGLPKIIEIAKYNNFGNRKSTDSKEIIGYFNFKSKFSILEPDEGFYRAITMDEFKQKVLVMVDKLDKKYGKK